MKRFWDKVEKTNTCWNWIGSIQERGYGQFRYQGKTHRSHRVSWIISHGPIPNNFCILHKCDNRRCVNPDHLFIGTVSDNQKDMVKKGHHKNGYSSGKRAGNIKLKEKDILNIRNKFAQGMSKTDIAKIYRVTRQNIRRIINFETWSHIHQPPP